MFETSVTVEWISLDGIYTLKFKVELEVEFSIEKWIPIYQIKI